MSVSGRTKWLRVSWDVVLGSIKFLSVSRDVVLGSALSATSVVDGIQFRAFRGTSF